MKFKIGDVITSKRIKKLSKKNLNKVFIVIEYYEAPFGEPTYRLDYYKQNVRSRSEYASHVEKDFRIVTSLELAIYI